jgi:hypothetical protein
MWFTPEGGALPYLGQLALENWREEILVCADMNIPFNQKQAHDLARRYSCLVFMIICRLLFRIVRCSDCGGVKESWEDAADRGHKDVINRTRTGLNCFEGQIETLASDSDVAGDFGPG